MSTDTQEVQSSKTSFDAVPSACRACPMFDPRSYPPRKESVEPPDQALDVLFVGEAPSWDEASPFRGAAGQFLRECVSFLKGRHVGFCYICRCAVPRGVTLDLNALEVCRAYMTRLLDRYAPKVVVALGSLPMKFFNPNAKSIAEARTRPLDLGPFWLVTGYHPVNHITGRMDLVGEYMSMLSTVDQILSGGFGKNAPDIRVVDRNNLGEVLAQLTRAEYVYMDVETDTIGSNSHPELSTPFMKGRSLLCCGFGTRKDEPVWVCPMDKGLLIPLLQASTKRIHVGHNLLYDDVVLEWFTGVKMLDAPFEDTFLMHASIDLGLYGNGLEDLARRLLAVPGWKHIAWDAVRAEETRRVALRREGGDILPATLRDIPFQALVAYNGRDVYYTMLLHPVIAGMDVPSVYKNFLKRVVGLLGRMELRGLRVDRERLLIVLAAYRRKVESLLDSLQEASEIRAVLKERGACRFNVNSPYHLSSLIRVTKATVGKTKTGKPKTDKATLTILAEDHALWRRVLAIRQMGFLVSKFLDMLRYHSNTRDGCIHASFNVARSEGSSGFGSDPSKGVVTGRLSCQNPNLHSIKKRGEGADVLRTIFVAPPGHLMAELDFSSIEVRILAWLAKCPNLIKLCNEGDPYRNAAVLIFGYNKPEEVSKVHRDMCKTGFLARMYGIGLHSFATRNGITEEKARDFFRFFERKFPEIKTYQAQLVVDAWEGKYIPTIFGRRRTFQFQQDDPDHNSHVERMCVNYPIQSTASDLTLYCALHVEKALKTSEFAIRNLVHDAIVGEVRQDKLDETLRKVSHIMCHPPGLKIPVRLGVGVSVGHNLGEMSEWKDPNNE